MKTKLLFGFAACLAAAAAIWFWTQARTRPAASAGAGASTAQPAISSGPKVPVSKPAHPTEPSGGGDSLIATAPVQLIVDPNQDYRQRLDAIHALPTDPSQISAADQEAIRTFLLMKGDTDGQQLGQAFKNDLMNAACELNPPPRWVGETLVQIYRDPNQDPVVRDYALQHMVEFYEQVELTHADAADSQGTIRGILWAAVKDTEGSTAGTALLGLMRLSREQPEVFDARQVTASALQLANNSSASELDHITALQVCARMGAQSAMPLLLDTARSGETLPLRISAVNALGVLGDAQCKPFLTNLVNGAEDRLILPAQTALDQINQREQQAARMKQKKS